MGYAQAVEQRLGVLQRLMLHVVLGLAQIVTRLQRHNPALHHNGLADTVQLVQHFGFTIKQRETTRPARRQRT